MLFQTKIGWQVSVKKIGLYLIKYDAKIRTSNAKHILFYLNYFFLIA